MLCIMLACKRKMPVVGTLANRWKVDGMLPLLLLCVLSHSHEYVILTEDAFIARVSGARNINAPCFETICCKFPSNKMCLVLNVWSCQPATSLGGVESLIEHRVVTDPSEDPHLLRLSIGVEDVEVCHWFINKTFAQ